MNILKSFPDGKQKLRGSQASRKDGSLGGVSGRRILVGSSCFRDGVTEKSLDKGRDKVLTDFCGLTINK